MWLRAIEDPHERGDPVGMDRVRAVLGPLMLRRTKGMVDKVRWHSKARSVNVVCRIVFNLNKGVYLMDANEYYLKLL